MSLTTSEMSPADFAACCNGNNGSGMGWGGDFGAWIILFLIFGMFGWGGFGGGYGGGMNGGVGSEVQRGFDHSAVVTKLDGLSYGLSDLGYAMSNGFHGVDSAVCNLGYQTQNGFNVLGSKIDSCCCETQRSIDGVRYDMATQACDTRNTIHNSTRDIIDNQNSNARAILDFLTQDKISSLQSEVQTLRLSASQANQNAVLMAAMDANKAEILRRTGAECPTPAYWVQPPTPISFDQVCNGGLRRCA